MLAQASAREVSATHGGTNEELGVAKENRSTPSVATAGTNDGTGVATEKVGTFC